jgi:hypothetical protein
MSSVGIYRLNEATLAFFREEGNRHVLRSIPADSLIHPAILVPDKFVEVVWEEVVVVMSSDDIMKNGERLTGVRPGPPGDRESKAGAT